MKSGDRIFLLCLFTFLALFIAGYIDENSIMKWGGVLLQFVAIAIFVILEKEERG